MRLHWVEFRRGFWIARTEVTNAQYERFQPIRKRSESAQGDDDPVVDVTWENAKAYCAWLSNKSGRAVRLPSEAEWECACRAGSGNEHTFGNDSSELSNHAWHTSNSNGRARETATKRPNRWGLHDLHGNVMEWCADTWTDSYDDADAQGSPWVENGSRIRVVRNGCWLYPGSFCRSARRSWGRQNSSFKSLGFRPAFSDAE
jgi:formylglycine-generating enzyme required for sulfatase activity